MKTEFIIRSEKSKENEIVLEFLKPIRFSEFVRYINENMKAEVCEDEASISITFKNPKNGFSILETVIDMFIEAYFLETEIESASQVLYDENMNPIPRLGKKGKVHKLQQPSIGLNKQVKDFEQMIRRIRRFNKLNKEEKEAKWEKFVDYITEKLLK